MDVFNRIQAPDGTETQVNYRLKKTFQGLRISGNAGERSGRGGLNHPLVCRCKGRRIPGPDANRHLMGIRVFRSGRRCPGAPATGPQPWNLGFQLTGHFGSVALHLAG